MPPLVSVYIPTKDRLPLLKRALYSVLAQTFRDIELIVVSDGTIDNTNEFVSSLKSDLTIRLINNSCSVGACTARNQAIEAAQGRFVTGLDDDDFFLPDRIAFFLDQWKYLTDKNTHFSCLFDSRIVYKPRLVQALFLQPKVDFELIKRSNEIGSQIFTLKERYLEVGLFDPEMPAWQDWDLWLRIIERFGTAINTGQATYIWDQGHNLSSITTSDYKIIRSACERLANKHGLKNIIQKSYLLASYSRYPQAKLNLIDISTIILAFQIKAIVRCLRDRKVTWNA